MVHEKRNRLIPRSVGAVFRPHARIFSIVMPPKCFVEGLGPWFPISGMERIRRRTPGLPSGGHIPICCAATTVSAQRAHGTPR
jgi:hypothetical protein